MRKKFIRRAALIGAAMSSLTAAQAQAQAAPEQPATADEAEGHSAIGEIVVTARKRAENLQDVPSAISALGAEQLEDLQISSFQDVGRTVPNVHIQKQAGSPTAPQFNIRGISAGSLNFQVDSGVALYVDGVYLGRPGNSGFDLADLERLEVARGPQGTLFGRNSTGGAISFITAAPTGEFGLIGEATVGNFARRRGRITLNTPEWNGFSARLTYVHDENTGYVKNSAPSRTYLFGEPFGPKTAARSFGANNIDSFLAAVRYTNGDALTVDYKFDYTDLVTTLDGMQLLNAGPTFSAATNFANQPALGGTNVVSLTRLDRLPIDSIAPSTQKTWGHSLTVNWDINSDITLKYIGAVRGFTVNTASELDGNVLVDPAGSGQPFQLLAAALYARQRQYSHELQLIGSSGKLDWVLGLFTFREKAYRNSTGTSNLIAPTGQPIPITNPGSYAGGGSLIDVLNKSHAAYAHLNFTPIEGIEVAGGIRYSYDDRTEDDLVDLPRTPPRGRYSATQDRFNYDTSIKAAITDDINVYAKFATGHVSGGIFNSVEFAPETVKSYEIGLKSELFDRRLRFDIALFDAKRKNRQVGGFLPGPGSILINAGGDHAQGVEIESSFVPVAGLTFTANYGFADVEGNKGVRPQQPRHTAYLAADYETQLASNGTKLRFRIDAQYEGRQFRRACPIGSSESTTLGCINLQNANLALDRALIIPGTWDLGARFTIADIPLGSGKGSISLWGKNLTDNDKLEYLFQVFPLQVLGTFQTPRTYGIDFRAEF